MLDLVCIGHVTLDKVITPAGTTFMPGGTAWYFSHAVRTTPVNYRLITAVGPAERHFITDLEKEGVDVVAFPSSATVCFENRYADDPDHRTQRVTRQAAPFTFQVLPLIDANIIHMGPLLAGDIPKDLIVKLADHGRLSLDVQGFLREVRNEAVFATDWAGKNDVLPLIEFLKASETELEALTGTPDIRSGARMLAAYGVKEVIVTLGAAGSIVLSRGRCYDIAPSAPQAVVDATGCGDTYMAGYLAERVKGAGIADAGRTASEMAGRKIERSGPYTAAARK